MGVRWSAPEPGQPGIAVGYTVARRHGSAVERNRMRRRVRSVVAELGTAWPAGHYLITLEAPVATMAYEELRDHVERAVKLLQR